MRAALLGALVGGSLVATGCGRDAAHEFQPDGSKVAHPGPPLLPDCVPLDHSTLGLSDPTAFGASSLAMLEAVLPVDDHIPFFWVGYDDLDAPVSYSPGVSETALRLSIEPREDTDVRQSVARPAETACERSHVEVPVHVALETVDGALAETFEADVSFAQRDVASFHVELAADELHGSLAFEPTGALAAGWQLLRLGIDVSLWRGGTSGALHPAFGKPAPTPETATPPLRTGPERAERASEGLADGPGVPSHWASLAVWPRRERCVDGPAVTADDRRFGWSPRDARVALAERATFSIVTDAGATPVRATFEEPPALFCMGQGVGDGQLSFTVPGRLTADSAASKAPLGQLDLSGTFLVSAESAVDGSGITEVVWQRSVPDVTSIAEDHAAFTANTGLFLDAPDHYQLFWWMAVAEQYRTTTSEPWQGSGEVVVYGADGFSEYSVGNGAFEGETAPPPTTFRTLEGDVLVYGTLAP